MTLKQHFEALLQGCNKFEEYKMSNPDMFTKDSICQKAYEQIDEDLKLALRDLNFAINEAEKLINKIP